MTDTENKPSMSVDSARALLLHVMRQDSEDSCCAGWVSGNEFRLWCQVVRDPLVAGELREAVLVLPLKELATMAGGWWVWPEGETPPRDGPLFVTMSEWLPMYEKHRQKLIEKYGPGGWAARLPFARGECRAFWAAINEEAEAPLKKPKVKTPSRETAAALLLRLMDEDAEFNWAASWVPEHEYMLWASVIDDEFGHENGGATEPDLMRDLAKAAGGWFTTSDGADEVEFVPMDRWLSLYRQYVERRRGEPDNGDVPE